MTWPDVELIPQTNKGFSSRRLDPLTLPKRYDPRISQESPPGHLVPQIFNVISESKSGKTLNRSPLLQLFLFGEQLAIGAPMAFHRNTPCDVPSSDVTTAVR